MNNIIYDCTNCNFRTSNVKDWKRHLTTQKHLKISKKPRISFVVTVIKVINLKVDYQGIPKHAIHLKIPNMKII